MRISDGNSDVCSSDLTDLGPAASLAEGPRSVSRAAASRSNRVLNSRNSKRRRTSSTSMEVGSKARSSIDSSSGTSRSSTDRKSVGEGKSVSVRLELGGSRTHTKKKKRNKNQNK